MPAQVSLQLRRTVLRVLAVILLSHCHAKAEAMECSAACLKIGNCNPENGKCQCPWGRTGDDCEVDALPACRLTPDALPHCGLVAVKSCECARQCRKFLCRPNAKGEEACDGQVQDPQHGCFEREGVPPEKQTAMVPEEGEAGVKYYKGYLPEQQAEVSAEEAMTWEGKKTLPLSACPDKCHMNGVCINGACVCNRGYEGGACETELAHGASVGCLNDCGGRGKCTDYFCHCKPPYFSLGCSRSKAYPDSKAIPSPLNFKIYMYELPSHVAWQQEYWAGWRGHDPIYTAYDFFLSQFLTSAVRTDDPEEASLFFIPAFTYAYTGNLGNPNDHFYFVTQYLKHNFPYWNRTSGRDHILWTPADRGACVIEGDAAEAIKLTHFGYSIKGDTTMGWGPGAPSHQDYACFHPLRDVVAPPFMQGAAAIAKSTYVDVVPPEKPNKPDLFFFAGGVRPNLDYSGGTRQALYDAAQKWNDPTIKVLNHFVGGDYWGAFRATKFCLAPYGHGWGIRLLQVMISDCVPLIIQEHVHQYYEDVLPYEQFSIRLSNADIPRLPEILRTVTDEQYAVLLAGVRKHYKAFLWEAEAGGQAFQYAILSLKRRYMNLKAAYFDAPTLEPPKVA